MTLAFWNTVNRDSPMGAARIVRREKYAWPGGYALALVTSDGGILCPSCVATEYHQISESARLNMRQSGWHPAGISCADSWEEPEYCDHCGKPVE
jgi:hypothetical protein